MPISVQEAKARVAEIDVYEELRRAGKEHTGMKKGDLTVSYHVISGASLDEQVGEAEAQAQELRAAADDEDAGNEAAARSLRKAYTALILRVVAKWDLSAVPEGPPIPLKAADIAAEVPLDIMTDIIEAVGAHRRPNRNARRP